MLEKIEFPQDITKEEYKERMKTMKISLGNLQRKCRELKVPVLILVDGLEDSGTGEQISKLMEALDPRGFQVYPIRKDTEEEAARPFLWKYWMKTPAKGEIVVLDSSWYRKVTIDFFHKEVGKKKLPVFLDEIRCFEKQLVEDGVCFIKVFLDITQEEAKTNKGQKINKKYKSYHHLVEDVLEATHTEECPWNLIHNQYKRQTGLEIYNIVIKKLEDITRKLEGEMEREAQGIVAQEPEESEQSKKVEDSIFSHISLDKSISREVYEVKLQEIQKKIKRLQGELYLKHIPVIIGFEGWDAGGKGGAIKRLTEKMDPTGYKVQAIGSPTEVEQSHHYLWRFWKEIPKEGQITIFDRTWYGRVLVERIEGFCSKAEWQRAYKEIVDMEACFITKGAIVLKFWLHIDKDEQERRFRDREQDPNKQWKITEEDWRNRGKWDDYEVAVTEMIEKTGTPSAPWTIVEGNDKLYARIKILEEVVAAMEKGLNKKL